jgi:hypothetical protein
MSDLPFANEVVSAGDTYQSLAIIPAKSAKCRSSKLHDCASHCFTVSTAGFSAERITSSCKSAKQSHHLAAEYINHASAKAESDSRAGDLRRTTGTPPGEL